MSRTRAELDHKLSALQAKVHDLSPRRLSERYLPDYFGDRMVGAILTLVGMKMAWSRYRAIKQRRETRERLAGYGRLH